MVDESWKNVAKLLTELDDSEQTMIASVMRRDLDLNQRNDQRVFKLKRVLKDFKKRGIVNTGILPRCYRCAQVRLGAFEKCDRCHHAICQVSGFFFI